MNMREETNGNGNLSQEPVGKLVHDFFDESRRVLNEGTRLLRSELSSAKEELRRDLRREAKKAGPAAALAGGGGVLLHAAVLMFVFALGALLAEAMPTWVAFLLTAVVVGAAGAALLYLARKRIGVIEIKPDQTIHRLEEDKRWAKGLTQRVRSNLQQNT